MTETGWKQASKSNIVHFVVFKPGVLRVVRPALCGRKASTWAEPDPRAARCFECAEHPRYRNRAWVIAEDTEDQEASNG